MGFFKQGSIRYMGGAGYGDVNIGFYGFGEIGLTRPVELNLRRSRAAVCQCSHRAARPGRPLG
jgi:hypothetical protein